MDETNWFGNGKGTYKNGSKADDVELKRLTNPEEAGSLNGEEEEEGVLEFEQGYYKEQDVYLPEPKWVNRLLACTILGLVVLLVMKSDLRKQVSQLGGVGTSFVGTTSSPTWAESGTDVAHSNPISTKTPTANHFETKFSTPNLTEEPTKEPTKDPTREPTKEPTNIQTKEPTYTQTKEPTNKPTGNLMKGLTEAPVKSSSNSTAQQDVEDEENSEYDSSQEVEDVYNNSDDSGADFKGEDYFDNESAIKVEAVEDEEELKRWEQFKVDTLKRLKRYDANYTPPYFINLGLPKTGTSSLWEEVSELGIDVSHYKCKGIKRPENHDMWAHFQELRREQKATGDVCFSGYYKSAKCAGMLFLAHKMGKKPFEAIKGRGVAQADCVTMNHFAFPQVDLLDYLLDSYEPHEIVFFMTTRSQEHWASSVGHWGNMRHRLYANLNNQTKFGHTFPTSKRKFYQVSLTKGTELLLDFKAWHEARVRAKVAEKGYTLIELDLEHHAKLQRNFTFFAQDLYERRLPRNYKYGWKNHNRHYGKKIANETASTDTAPVVP